MSEPKIRVALVNDYEVVIAGLAAALRPYADRIEIVEVDAGVLPQAAVDIVLYDTFGQSQGDRITISDLNQGGSAAVLIFSWNVDDDLIARALDHGAAGYVSKTSSVKELVRSLEAVHRGERVIHTPQSDDDFGRWPGDRHGLSNRESEVLALITQGMSNGEICERTYLSPNTLKSYIRNLYRKLGVTRRSQAVLWGIENGFRPDHVRRTPGN